jgi:hypothetical protein
VSLHSLLSLSLTSRQTAIKSAVAILNRDCIASYSLSIFDFFKAAHPPRPVGLTDPLIISSMVKIFSRTLLENKYMFGAGVSMIMISVPSLPNTF